MLHPAAFPHQKNYFSSDRGHLTLAELSARWRQSQSFWLASRFARNKCLTHFPQHFAVKLHNRTNQSRKRFWKMAARLIEYRLKVLCSFCDVTTVPCVEAGKRSFVTPELWRQKLSFSLLIWLFSCVDSLLRRLGSRTRAELASSHPKSSEISRWHPCNFLVWNGLTGNPCIDSYTDISGQLILSLICHLDLIRLTFHPPPHSPSKPELVQSDIQRDAATSIYCSATVSSGDILRILRLQVMPTPRSITPVFWHIPPAIGGRVFTGTSYHNPRHNPRNITQISSRVSTQPSNQHPSACFSMGRESAELMAQVPLVDHTRKEPSWKVSFILALIIGLKEESFLARVICEEYQ